jgi:hemerythrin-like metal-binding protein
MDFQWMYDYNHNLGLIEVDIQHKRFYSLIEMLYLADESSYDDILTEINEYITFHFSNEEEMMDQYEYGEMNIHVLEHNILKKKIAEAIHDSQKGDLKFESLILFLVKWFTDHTTETDKKMGNYILKQEINQ